MYSSSLLYNSIWMSNRPLKLSMCKTSINFQRLFSKSALSPVFPIWVNGNFTHLVSQAQILDACVILDYVLSLILYIHYISRSCCSTIKIHAEFDNFLLLLRIILYQMIISHLHYCNSSKRVLSASFLAPSVYFFIWQGK